MSRVPSRAQSRIKTRSQSFESPPIKPASASSQQQDADAEEHQDEFIPNLMQNNHNPEFIPNNIYNNNNNDKVIQIMQQFMNQQQAFMNQQNALMQTIVNKLTPPQLDINPIHNNNNDNNNKNSDNSNNNNNNNINSNNSNSGTIINSHLDKFDGHDGELLFTWLVQAKSALEVVSDKNLVQRIIPYLTGSAALFGVEYVKENASNDTWKNDWDKFVKAISRRFMASLNPVLIRSAIMNISFTGTAPAELTKYINAMENQFYKLPGMSEQEKIGYLYKPLKDFVKTRMINVDEGITYNEYKNKLMNVCMTIELNNKSKSSQQDSKPQQRASRFNQMQAQEDKNEATTTELNQFKTQSSTPDNKQEGDTPYVPKRCRKCGSKDHIDDAKCTADYIPYVSRGFSRRTLPAAPKK
jgi:hypothetical protein